MTFDDCEWYVDEFGKKEEPLTQRIFQESTSGFFAYNNFSQFLEGLEDSCLVIKDKVSFHYWLKPGVAVIAEYILKLVPRPPAFGVKITLVGEGSSLDSIEKIIWEAVEEYE